MRRLVLFGPTWSGGQYVLTAQATTTTDAATVSAPVNISVTTNVPPQITLIQPTNGATFIEGDMMHLLANATDK
jgi:hypothetical protein